MEYADTIEAIRWISPTVADWVESHNNFNEQYAKKFPNKRPAVVAAAPAIPND